MTEPSKEAIERANALIRAVTPENVLSSAKVQPDRNYRDDAFCRFIQEVSDVAKEAREWAEQFTSVSGRIIALEEFIIPNPEPDMGNLLIEVFDTALDIRLKPKGADMLSAELAKRGYEIRKVSE